MYRLTGLPVNILRFASQLLSNRIYNVLFLSGVTSLSFLWNFPLRQRSRGLDRWERLHKCKRPHFLNKLPQKIAFFPLPRKKKVLIKPIYFNTITFIPQIKMHSFCQTPAHYTGFSFLSEGLTLSFSILGGVLGRGGCIQGPPMSLGRFCPVPRAGGRGWSQPCWWRAMLLPWGELKQSWGLLGESLDCWAFFSKTLKVQSGIHWIYYNFALMFSRY